MKRLRLIILASFVGTMAANGQTSVVQDAKGETSLPVGVGGVVAINAKNESISASYGIPLKKQGAGVNPPPIYNHNYLGISFDAKGKNGIANVIKNDEFQYDGSLGAYYFQNFDDRRGPANTTLQYHLSFNLLFSQFKLYDPARDFSKQVYDKNKGGFKIQSGLNHTFHIGDDATKPLLITGIAINGGERNNTGDLKTIEVSNSVSITDAGTGTTRVVQSDKSTPYNLSQYKHSVGFWNINADFGTRLREHYILLVHPRLSGQGDRKRQWNPAAGLYFTKDGAPSEIVAGFQVQILDWDNSAGSTKSRSQRTTFNVVAGFSF
ncbi:hypothetical protein [Pedobacter sp. SYSU D00535]|uniref:hypothetical protein n=1 Tax=Pedobacter sp. SYSU D00535 TaxID=2810308 RepID=UPI001A960A78|nr:hypothetical protein [Pedobacter sp. SYSU D00535]